MKTHEYSVNQTLVRDESKEMCNKSLSIFTCSFFEHLHHQKRKKSLNQFQNKPESVIYNFCFKNSRPHTKFQSIVIFSFDFILYTYY